MDSQVTYASIYEKTDCTQKYICVTKLYMNQGGITRNLLKWTEIHYQLLGSLFTTQTANV